MFYLSFHKTNVGVISLKSSYGFAAANKVATCFHFGFNIFHHPFEVKPKLFILSEVRSDNSVQA